MNDDTDVIEHFRTALTNREIIPPLRIEADGRLHRCDASGQNGKNDAAYVLHLGSMPAGGFQNHRDGRGWEKWRADVSTALTRGERAAHLEQICVTERNRGIALSKRQLEARFKSARILKCAQPCRSHPYLTQKRISAHGARIWRDNLILPLHDADEVVHSLQFIQEDGSKRFLTGGRKRGCYFAIGVPVGVVCIVEGFATGASVHEATGYAVAVAFDAGNLLPVGQALRSKFPQIELRFCADDDRQTPGNPGITKAGEAARRVGGTVVVPDFGGRP